jgi:hypothetical protein
MSEMAETLEKYPALNNSQMLMNEIVKRARMRK